MGSMDTQNLRERSDTVGAYSTWTHAFIYFNNLAGAKRLAWPDGIAPFDPIPQLQRRPPVTSSSASLSRHSKLFFFSNVYTFI